MTARMQFTPAQPPEWVVAEMPPGYRTRLQEIERLTADLRAMDRFGRVLWETGEGLKEAVAELFTSLRCEVGPAPGTAGLLSVKFGDARRLLVLVSNAPVPVQRTSEELAQAFQAVQFAIADDRVVFVPGHDAATPPANRPAPIQPEALTMLQRMGVNAVTTSTLFGLWLGHEDHVKVRKTLERLHAQDGGLFTAPAR